MKNRIIIFILGVFFIGIALGVTVKADTLPNTYIKIENPNMEKLIKELIKKDGFGYSYFVMQGNQSNARYFVFTTDNTCITYGLGKFTQDTNFTLANYGGYSFWTPANCFGALYYAVAPYTPDNCNYRLYIVSDNLTYITCDRDNVSGDMNIGGYAENVKWYYMHPNTADNPNGSNLFILPYYSYDDTTNSLNDLLAYFYTPFNDYFNFKLITDVNSRSGPNYQYSLKKVSFLPILDKPDSYTDIIDNTQWEKDLITDSTWYNDSKSEWEIAWENFTDNPSLSTFGGLFKGLFLTVLDALNNLRNNIITLGSNIASNIQNMLYYLFIPNEDVIAKFNESKEMIYKPITNTIDNFRDLFLVSEPLQDLYIDIMGNSIKFPLSYINVLRTNLAISYIIKISFCMSVFVWSVRTLKEEL